MNDAGESTCSSLCSDLCPLIFVPRPQLTLYALSGFLWASHRVPNPPAAHYGLASAFERKVFNESNRAYIRMKEAGSFRVWGRGIQVFMYSNLIVLS